MRRRGFGTTAGWVAVAGLLHAGGATSARTDEPPAPESPAQAPIVFSADVDVILVDAVVTDKQGQPVEGLTAEDFVVREDGEPQVLTSFEAVKLPEAAAVKASGRSSANDGPAESRRVFVVVMDDAGLGTAGAVAARKAAKQFLTDATRPGDLVSVVVPAAGLTWSAFVPEGEAQLASIVDSVKPMRSVAPELVGGWEALSTAQNLDPMAQERARQRLDSSGLLPRAPRFPGESETAFSDRNRSYQEPFLRVDSRRQLDQDRARRYELFTAVRTAVEGVASVKGRKSVLLLSEGFIREPNDPAFRDLVAALRRSNASIYFLNVQGLRSGTAADSRQSGDRSASTRTFDSRESSGAEIVAEETGGFALHQPNDLPAGLARIAREASSYYLLGYSSTNQKRDGKLRRLQVDVRGTNLSVRARKGYYGPLGEDGPARASNRPGADPDLERALTGAEAREIPLRLTAFTLQPVDRSRVRVRLVAEVGAKGLRFDRDPDGSQVATLDVAVATNHVHAAGRQRTPWKEWTVKVPSQADGADVWLPLEGTFDLPVGATQARVAVRDRRSRALGSVVHGFEVPEPGAWRVSTPILSDMPGDDRRSPPRMQVSHNFVSGTPLYCYLEVYPGQEKGKAAARAGTSFAYTLIDAGGRVRKSREASPVEVGPAGVPARLETIPLSGLSAGQYELRMSVRDEATGRTQEMREPIVVRKPLRPDGAIYQELVQAYLAGDLARSSSGLLEWKAQDLEKVAASLPVEETAARRGALLMHTVLAFRLWGNARGPEADAQIQIGRTLLARGASAELHRDWLLALGRHHLAAAAPGKALSFFEEATRLFPESAEAWLGAGMAYEVAAFPGSFAFAPMPVHNAAGKAERSYREAVRLDPGLAHARLRLGRVLSLKGDAEEAEKELAAAVASSTEGPTTALAHLFGGGLRDAKGDLAGAVRHYQAAVAADAEQPMSAFALSEALYRSGRDREAAAALTAALSASAASEISPWYAYHLGLGRKNPLLETLRAGGSVVADWGH